MQEQKYMSFCVILPKQQPFFRIHPQVMLQKSSACGELPEQLWRSEAGAVVLTRQSGDPLVEIYMTRLFPGSFGRNLTKHQGDVW